MVKPLKRPEFIVKYIILSIEVRFIYHWIIECWFNLKCSKKTSKLIFFSIYSTFYIIQSNIHFKYSLYWNLIFYHATATTTIQSKFNQLTTNIFFSASQNMLLVLLLDTHFLFIDMGAPHIHFMIDRTLIVLLHFCYNMHAYITYNYNIIPKMVNIIAINNNNQSICILWDDICIWCPWLCL